MALTKIDEDFIKSLRANLINIKGRRIINAGDAVDPADYVTLRQLTGGVVAVPVNKHAETHEVGGGDEIDVTGLSGVLRDGQIPADHDHTSTTGSGGPLTNDEHDGYSDYTGIATPSAPAAGKGRLYTRTENNHTLPYFIDQDGSEFLTLRDSIIVVRNTSGGTLNKGQAVDIYSATGSIPNVRKALANDRTRHAEGLLAEDIANNGFGLCVIQGVVANLDTSAFVTGDQIYLSDTGTFSTTPGTYSQELGIIINAHATQGIILVLINALDETSHGTYTPTLTNVSNISSSTAYVTCYQRVKDIVRVAGKVDITPTDPGIATELGISLQIASNLAAETDLNGLAISADEYALVARIMADTTNDRAALKFVANAVVSQTLGFDFMYRIL